MKKVLTINRCNTDNLGDQAIYFALHLFLKKNNYSVNSEDLLLRSNKKWYEALRKHTNKRKPNLVTLKRLKWFYQNSRKINKVLELHYDTIIIGGGQLINSNVLFPIALLTWIWKIKKLSKAHIIFFGVGCDPIFSKIEKIMYSYVLQRIDQIYLRDKQSTLNLKKNFHINSKQTYDLVFLFHNNFNKIVEHSVTLLGVTSLKRFQRYKAISAEQYFDIYYRLVKKELINKAHVKLFYTTVDDYNACLELKEVFFRKYNLSLNLADTSSIETLVAEIKNSNKVISQRMHALILGLINKCEIESIVISDKLAGFVKEFQNEAIDLNTIKTKVENDLNEALTYSKVYEI